MHPHRGFETITIAWQGAVAHHDSAGHSGVIYPGDVQWMTAASGILHKEYHEEVFSRSGGPFQMAQLWVNLPKSAKMSPPKYQGLTDASIPRVTLPDGGGYVKLIAGQLGQVQGAAETFTPMNLWDVHLRAGGRLEARIPAAHNTGLLVVEGAVSVNGHAAALNDFVLFENEGEILELTATEDAIVLLLSGLPIGEPVAQYGPFVMNTAEEIRQAIDDFNAGKFGVLA